MKSYEHVRFLLLYCNCQTKRLIFFSHRQQDLKFLWLVLSRAMFYFISFKTLFHKNAKGLWSSFLIDNLLDTKDRVLEIPKVVFITLSLTAFRAVHIVQLTDFEFSFAPLFQKNCLGVIWTSRNETPPPPEKKNLRLFPFKSSNDCSSQSSPAALRWWLFIHRPISLLAEAAPSPGILINRCSNWLIKSCLQKPKWLTDSLNYDTFSGCKMADHKPPPLTFMRAITILSFNTLMLNESGANEERRVIQLTTFNVYSQKGSFFYF